MMEPKRACPLCGEVAAFRPVSWDPAKLECRDGNGGGCGLECWADTFDHYRGSRMGSQPGNYYRSFADYLDPIGGRLARLEAIMGSDKLSSLEARIDALERQAATWTVPTNAADIPLPAGAGPDDVASGDVTLADEYKPLATAGSADIDASGQRRDRPGQAPAYDAAGKHATHPDTAATKQPKDDVAPAAGKDTKKD